MVMELEASTQTGVLSRRLRSLPAEVATKVVDMAGAARKLARDDPRRVTHSLKVGLALTLVSIIYYLEPVYDNFQDTAIWTVMTVVVVFEFTVGGTLARGLSRGAATVVAGTLALGVHRLASLVDRAPESVILSIFVFLIATVSTFIRFFPKIKAKYDYGILIFILTFCMVSVSGFREEDVLKMAFNRLTTVLIGGALCIIVSIGICPVWAGENLHNLIALNIDKLGTFLEGFGDEYFKTYANGEDNTNSGGSLQGYKSVLGSKAIEEATATLASWEPRHGKFRFRHPWQQYLKLGALIRQCAYRIDDLHAHLCNDAKAPIQIREQIEETCKSISSETGKALKELSVAVKTMTLQRNPDLHLTNAQNFVEKLKASLKDGLCMDDDDLLAILPCGAVASLLIDVVECTVKVAEAVHELERLAKFKPEKRPSARIEPTLSDSCPHLVLEIIDGQVSSDLPENGSSNAAPVASSPIQAPASATAMNN